MTAPLLTLIAEDERREVNDWWADFLANCAARKARRIAVGSKAAHRGWQTRRNNMGSVQKGRMT